MARDFVGALRLIGHEAKRVQHDWSASPHLLLAIERCLDLVRTPNTFAQADLSTIHMEIIGDCVAWRTLWPAAEWRGSGTDARRAATELAAAISVRIEDSLRPAGRSGDGDEQPPVTPNAAS